MGTFFNFQRRWGEVTTAEHLGWLPLLSLIAFFITFSVGMNNVPTVIMDEMFPSRFRHLLGAINSFFNLACTFIIVQFFPDILKGLGKDGTFYFFACCTLLSVAFVYFLVPETIGKTVEEMGQLFESKNVCRNKNLESVAHFHVFNVDNQSYYLKSTFPIDEREMQVTLQCHLKAENGELQLNVNILKVVN